MGVVVLATWQDRSVLVVAGGGELELVEVGEVVGVGEGRVLAGVGVDAGWGGGVSGCLDELAGGAEPQGAGRGA